MMNLKQWCENLQQLLSDKQERFEVMVHKETEVAYGWDEDFNKEYCDEHHIPYYAQKRDGGTIVCAKDNIGVAFVYENQKYKCFMLSKMLDDLCGYLKQKGLNATRSNNDVLIDGFKVASGCGVNIPPDYKWAYDGAQISIYQDLDVIKNVCLKPMVKVPKALSDYGITTNEMLDFIDTWKKENVYE